MSAALAASINEHARALGFQRCGITHAGPVEHRDAFLAWLERGDHAGMAYLAREPERRCDPRIAWPEARSIVVVGMDYGAAPEAEPDPERAVFARYARGDDYHDVIVPRLRELLEFIRAEAGEPVEGRPYTDTGPFLERELAHRAGLGWFGKNTMLIDTRRGSWFLIGLLLLNVDLPADEPARGGCGTCTRCLDACPTGALTAPYSLDAHRCISYLTIEHRDAIPADLAAKMGNRVFGCDICQEVCPFNRRATPTAEPAFQPRDATQNRSLADLLNLTDEEFRSGFKNSPLKRAKRRGLLRNAAAALSCRSDADAIAALEHALDDPEPLVREQAAMSLRRTPTRGGDRSADEEWRHGR